MQAAQRTDSSASSAARQRPAQRPAVALFRAHVRLRRSFRRNQMAKVSFAVAVENELQRVNEGADDRITVRGHYALDGLGAPTGIKYLGKGLPPDCPVKSLVRSHIRL